MLITFPSPVLMLITYMRSRPRKRYPASLISTSDGLLYPNLASINSILSRLTRIGLKKVIAADVARATY